MKLKLYTFLCLMLLFNITAFTQKTLTITTATATVNWSTAAWSPAGIPGLTDDVIINFNRTASGNAAATVNIDVPVSIKSLTINGNWGSTGVLGSTGTKTLRVEAINNLTTSGGLTMSSTGGNDFSSSQYVELVGRNVTISIGGTTTIGGTTNTKYCYLGGASGYLPNINFGNDVTFNARSGTRSNATFIFSKNGSQVFTNNCTSGLSQYVDFANMQVGNGTSTTNLNMAGTATYSTDITGGNLTVKANATLNIPETWTLNQINSPDVGTLLLENNSTLKLGDDVGGIDIFGNNFPDGFSSLSLQPLSTVEYNGSSSLTQYVYEGAVYGNLVLSRGSGTGTAIKYPGNSSNFFAPTTGQINIIGSLTIGANTNLNIRNTAFFGTYDYPLLVGNSWTNNGTFTQQNGTVTFNGTSNGTIGGTAATTFYNLTMNKSAANNRMVLSNNATVSRNLTLTNGRLATGNNLLTWNNSGGTLSNPTPANSYIATCDASGNALTAAGLTPSATTPFAGTVGFAIKNVLGNTYITLPVGPDFVSPNRFAINPGITTGPTTDLTVVVGKGDLLNTPSPRVNRVWYVRASNTATVAATGVRLYFKKYDWLSQLFGINQDEIETGFAPGNVMVARRDYSAGNFYTHRSLPRISGTLDGTEGYAEYTLSTGSSVPGYYRFTAGNFGAIVLAADIVNVKALQENSKIKIQWTSLNESGVNAYEVEHATDGINFLPVAKQQALNNGKLQNDYAAYHLQPVNGKSFYRIKMIDKDGSLHYSSIISITVNNAKTAIAVIPNPVQQMQVNIQLYNLPAGRYNMALYNNGGQALYAASINHNGGFATHTISLPANTARGVYHLKVSNQSQQYIQKVIVE